MKIMSEGEWEQLMGVPDDWPFGAWHWKSRTRLNPHSWPADVSDFDCNYDALIHEEGNISSICSVLVAAIALEDDGTYSVIERGQMYDLDATGFASAEAAKKYVEVQLALDGELNRCWNVRQ